MLRARNACPWCCNKADVVQAGKTIQVRYFLTRMGKMEHSHIIHFQHVNSKSIHLRDVKKWLSDVEGKEMPQSYAWSYKRRYKTGFVWHDVVDDDVITPIASDEYVLKGSAISSFRPDHCTCKKQAAPGAEGKGDVLAGRLIAALEVNVEEDGSDCNRLTRSKESQRSTSLSPSHVEGDESAVVPMTRRNARVEGKKESSEGTKGGGLGGGAVDAEHRESNRISSDKHSKRPICSQCGKTFKPERLHAHMKSCKGLKALKKLGSERPVQTTTTEDQMRRHEGEDLCPPLLAITTT